MKTKGWSLPFLLEKSDVVFKPALFIINRDNFKITITEQLDKMCHLLLAEYVILRLASTSINRYVATADSFKSNGKGKKRRLLYLKLILLDINKILAT